MIHSRPNGETNVRARFFHVARLLGSLKLAVVLLPTLAAIIAAATILEAKYSRAHAQWFVYSATWFVILLAILGINIFCAAAIRWPWKRHQIGFVITHAGLLVLLAGAIQTFVGGIEGSVTLLEGETTSSMMIPNRTQVDARWIDRPKEPPYLFSFEGGPVAWRKGTTLSLGDVDDVKARVLNYIPHAEAVSDWIEDKSETGGPYVRFSIAGPHSGAIEHFLSDQEFGDEILVGPVRLHLERAASDRMLEDFLNPPIEDGEKGTLAIFYKDHYERISVDGNVGRKIELGETGVSVEIVEYFANAKPDAHSRFTSRGDEPANPMVELRVHLPEQPPWRQLAFAKSPLLNLNTVHGHACPVAFRYYHRGMKPMTAIEMMQTSDGKLHCRAYVGGEYTPVGEVKAGHRVELPSKFTFAVTRYLPHARWKVTFEPAEAGPEQKNKPEAAAEVEIQTAGVTQSVWLQRNHAGLGTRSILTSQGQLQVRLGYAQQPLDFDLKLVNFKREMNPGKTGNAAFSSVVRVMDQDADLNEEREISMNEPLTHKRLTFYQSGFRDAGHGMEASTFSVAYDPGRFLKYAGSLMICLGIATMFYMRAYFFKQVPNVFGGGSGNGKKGRQRRETSASDMVPSHNAAACSAIPVAPQATQSS